MNRRGFLLGALAAPIAAPAVARAVAPAPVPFVYGRASGGIVRAASGQAYLVGEAGPEALWANKTPEQIMEDVRAICRVMVPDIPTSRLLGETSPAA